MKEPSTSREDPTIMKNTLLSLDKTESQHEHKNDETNATNVLLLFIRY